ncbi:MAG TPA: M35 family metallo-endopeptidase [Thermoanaerobaculia bacterium]|nr:M35 family metallo-endopeptidase [Thermoanaerobaculia bacterium]
MFRRRIAIGLLGLAGVASLGLSPRPALGQTKPVESRDLAAGIEIAKARVAAAEPVTVRFTLTNRSAETQRVLKWNTPLEGLYSDLFRVVHAGREVPYIGVLVKRGTPKPDDYVTLAPGGSTSAEIDLAKGYALAETGSYEVRLATIVRHAPANGGTLAPERVRASALRTAPATFELTEGRQAPALAPAPLATPRAALPKNGKAAAAKQANFENCTDAQKPDLDEAHQSATNLAAGSTLAIEVTPEAKRSAAPRYKTWFGAYTAARYATVDTHYQKIYDALLNQQITFNCQCNDVPDPANTYAYVFANQPYRIHLCALFWAAALEGTDSRSGTLIHETSHFDVVAGTGDHVYGQSAAKTLAIGDPDQAIDNADNHEYFAENNPAEAMGIGLALFLALLGLALAAARGFELRRRRVESA